VLPSFEAAYEEAIVAARGLLAREVGQGPLSLDRHIEVTDSDGNSLVVVSFAEAINLKPGARRLPRSH